MDVLNSKPLFFLQGFNLAIETLDGYAKYGQTINMYGYARYGQTMGRKKVLE